MSAHLHAHAAWITRDLIGPCVQYRETCTAHGGDVDPGDYEHRCTVARRHAATVVERLRQVADPDPDAGGEPRPGYRYAVRRVADGRVTDCESREVAEQFAAVGRMVGEGPHEVLAREVWEGPWVPIGCTLGVVGRDEHPPTLTKGSSA